MQSALQLWDQDRGHADRESGIRSSNLTLNWTTLICATLQANSTSVFANCLLFMGNLPIQNLQYQDAGDNKCRARWLQAIGKTLRLRP